MKARTKFFRLLAFSLVFIRFSPASAATQEPYKEARVDVQSKLASLHVSGRPVELSPLYGLQKIEVKIFSLGASSEVDLAKSADSVAVVKNSLHERLEPLGIEGVFADQKDTMPVLLIALRRGERSDSVQIVLRERVKLVRDATQVFHLDVYDSGKVENAQLTFPDLMSSELEKFAQIWRRSNGK